MVYFRPLTRRERWREFFWPPHRWRRQIQLYEVIRYLVTDPAGKEEQVLFPRDWPAGPLEGFKDKIDQRNT